MNIYGQKVILPGGAGLVGQNLVARMKAHGFTNIVVLDKHCANLEVLKQVQPDITAEYADLAEPGDWLGHFVGADVVVMLQAQIGGNDQQQFVRNNILATRHVLDALTANSVPHLIHISSSVVESRASDYYTTTKKEQEELVLASRTPVTVLRPTLMFGWFDRKHLGWLSRFMKAVPVFPIPGNGRYVRQPLYVGDFCNIIIRCIERGEGGQIVNVSGLEKVEYIDIIREIKKITGARSGIVKIPVAMFRSLLWLWGLFDRNPPFTTQQLDALIIKEEFEITDWPQMFDVRPTPFHDAMMETFSDPRYSHVVLEF